MKKRCGKHESGQASVEVTISLLGIIFVMAGILFFGGIGITSIKTLLLSRQSSERFAVDSDAGERAGSDIGTWNYTTATYRKNPEHETIAIPFLANDASIGVSTGIGTGYFSSPFPSLGELGDGIPSTHPQALDIIRYRFYSPSYITGVEYSPRLTSGSSFNLANLQFSSGALPEELTRGGGDEEVYTLYKLPDSRNLKEGLARAGLLDFRNIKVSEWRSNTTAYPAMKPLN